MNSEDTGVYHFTAKLAGGAKTGRWKLVYRMPGENAKNAILHEYFFSVEDFLPERLKLTLFDGNPSKRRLLPSRDSFTIPVTGVYLYGAPAAGNKADGQIFAELERHPFDKWPTYFFGIDGEKIDNRQQALDAVALDDNGRGSWQVPLSPWSGVRSPLALTATVSLYESGGRPVTRSISVTRVAQDQLVGIEPQFKDEADNDSNAAFKLLLTDRQGKPQAGGGYQLSLVREDRNYYWNYSDTQGWTWHYDPMEYQVYSASIRFEAARPTLVSVPVEWGNYRLEVKDDHNHTISSYRFSTRWCWWGNQDGNNALKPDQVRMTFLDAVYHQGQQARLLLTPPVDGLATITVEDNDEILWVHRQQVAAAGTRIDIPIATNWFRHDIYVTATVLSPGKMRHLAAPKRAFGFINLPIERPDAHLGVAVKVPAKIQPLTNVKADITVTGGGSIPEDTYVTLAAVDEGVLNITRFATPDAAAYLYGARRFDAKYYDIYGRIIENAGFEYTRQRFGGGFVESAAQLSRGGNRPRSDVKIMSWQSKPVKVAADGTARISMEMPQFNGKVRWMAVVYSGQSYGKAEAESTVADKVVVQLSKPRFLAPGDSSQLALDLSNRSGVRQHLEVEMTVSGALIPGNWRRQLDLNDSAKTTLRFPVRAKEGDQGDIRLLVTGAAEGGQQLTLHRKWFVGIRSAYPSVTRKLQAVIDPQHPWKPTPKQDDLLPASVQARLLLSDRPPIDVAAQFDHLLHYPYGCTEQSTSSGYPWVLVDTATAQRMGLASLIQRQFKHPYTEAFRKTEMDAAVARIVDRQNANGGFGLWANTGQEEFWLSVYATDFLTDAQLAGAAVPGDALNKALTRLQQYVKGTTRVSIAWSESSTDYTFAVRSYAAYVLAKVGRLNLSDLRRFYSEVKEKKYHSPLPWIELGYAFEVLGDKDRAEVVYGEARTAEYLGDQRYYGDYGSRLRDLALGYAILAKRGRARGETLLEIFNLIKRRNYLSTQERNALFRAAVAASVSTNAGFQAIITTTGGEQRLERSKPFASLLGSAQLASIREIAAPGGKVFASLEWLGQYVAPPQAYARGVSIERQYLDLDGRPRDLNTLKSGDLILVRLLVSPERRTPDGLVVDLLPAGLELENQNLGNSSVDLGKIVIDGEHIGNWRQKAGVRHVEYRDDRFVAALDMQWSRYSSSRYALYYLARAVTPGTYKVPPPYVEDMYRPYYQGIGESPKVLTVKP